MWCKDAKSVRTHKLLPKPIYKALIRRVNFQCSETMQKKIVKSLRKPSVPFFSAPKGLISRFGPSATTFLCFPQSASLLFVIFLFFHPSRPFFSAGARVLSLRPFFRLIAHFVSDLYFILLFFLFYSYIRGRRIKMYIFFCGGHTRRVWDYVLHTNARAFSLFILFSLILYLWFVVVSFCRFVIVTLWTGPLCCVIELGDLLKPRKGLNYLFAFFRNSHFFPGYFFHVWTNLRSAPNVCFIRLNFFALERSGCCVLYVVRMNFCWFFIRAV